MKRLTSSIRACRLVVLAVVSAALLFTSTTPALAAGKSDEVLLENSRKHYIQALIAYNDGPQSAVPGLLQAAASNAKHVDPDLAGLLEYLSVNFDTSSSVQTETILVKAREIAYIYNSYNSQYSWGYPMLSDDANKPLAVPPGETGTT